MDKSDPCPTLRGLPLCFGSGAGIYDRFRPSAPSQPSSNLWIRLDFLLRAKTGCLMFSPEGDPTLGGSGLLAVFPLPFPRAQTELLSTYILIIFAKMTRVLVIFLLNYWERWGRGKLFEK